MKIRHLQETARAFATRDKNVLEGNSFKVYFWSILQIAIMLTVGFVQVGIFYTLRIKSENQIKLNCSTF